MWPVDLRDINVQGLIYMKRFASTMIGSFYITDGHAVCHETFGVSVCRDDALALAKGSSNQTFGSGFRLPVPGRLITLSLLPDLSFLFGVC